MNVHGFILPSRIVGMLLLVPAVINIGLAVWFFTSTNRFLNDAVSVRGVVIAFKPSSDREGTTYTPEFEFTDAAGEKHRATRTWSSSPPSHRVGDKVEVLYLPGDPSSARMRSFGDLWATSAIFAGLAILPLVGGFVFIWLVPFAIRRVWPMQSASPATPT